MTAKAAYWAGVVVFALGFGIAFAIPNSWALIPVLLGFGGAVLAIWAKGGVSHIGSDDAKYLRDNGIDPD